MLVSLQGPTLSLEHGDEYKNCDPAEAKRLVEAGFAVPIVGQEHETATVDLTPVEKRQRSKRKAG